MGGALSPDPPLLYRVAAAAVHGALPLLTRASPSLAAQARDRAGSLRRFRAWAAGRTAAPLVLFHAASAGELRQVEPVLRRLRRRHPEWQFAATCFSRSGLPVLEQLPLEIAGLLPWDVPRELTPFLDALEPGALVFGKHDLWPGLVALAKRRGIPLGLIAGSVRPGSARLRWPARSLLAPAYRALARAGAVSEADAGRLRRLGVASERLTILGEPRVDTVLDLVGDRQPAPGSMLLVAGSTWPEDEAVLLQAFAAVRSRSQGARLLLAPHRPGPEAERRIRSLAAKCGLPAPASDPAAPLQLLNRIGPLAERYGEGAIAYVGGGFGGAGLHSVLEPAGWGLPILTGPRFRESREAVRLQEAGALSPVSGGAPASRLAELWGGLLAEEGRRREAGSRARQVLLQEAGAADRCAELVAGLVAAGPGATSPR